MIDFRYHLVSVVGILFALAVGIVLGTTTLSGPVLDGLNHSAKTLTNSNASLSSQVDALTAARAGDAQFLATVAPLAVAGRLSGQSVAVVAAPGVTAAERSGVITLLQDAGALVNSEVQLGPAWLDPSRDPLLASLATRLAGRPLPAGSGAAQAADQLAPLLVHRSGSGGAAGSGLTDSLSAYQQAGVLSVAAGGTNSATLAVLLAPASVTGGGSGVVAGDLLAFASALSSHAAAAVLAGPSGAASGRGSLAGASAAFGSAPPVIAGDDTTRGQLSVVLQLYHSLGR